MRQGCSPSKTGKRPPRLSIRSGVSGLLLVAFVIPAVVHGPVAQLPEVAVKYWNLPEAYKDRITYFLLIGNSNMQGRAVPTPEDKTHHPQVIRVDIAQPVMGWAHAREPINTYARDWSGMGCGLAFGKEYARRHPDRYVGLLACGLSGVSFGSWVKNARCFNKLYGVSSSGEYQSRYDIINPATKQKYHRWGGIILVWGGQEMITEALLRSTLPAIAKAWRDTLGDARIPFLVESPPLFTMNKDPGVANAIKQLSTYVPYARGIDASDLKSLAQARESGLGSLETHYSHTSNLLLAKRFSEALEQMSATPTLPCLRVTSTVRAAPYTSFESYLHQRCRRTDPSISLVGRRADPAAPGRAARLVIPSVK